MKRWLKVLWPIGLVSVSLLVITAGAFSLRGTAQAQTAVMKVVPASQTVDVGDGNFTVDIVIENVSNLGSFEFTLTFDPSVLRLVGVKGGSFLGSTGRVVGCPGAIHISPAPSVPSEDAVRFGCTSSNPSKPSDPSDTGIPGASGSGLLATITFAPQKAGLSQLRLGLTKDQFQLSDPFAEDLLVDAEGGSVEVIGSGPTATPEPDEPTPIPTETYPEFVTPTATPADPSWLTPEPGEAPLTRLIPSSDTTGASSGGASSSNRGATASGSAGGATGDSPVAGSGPPDQDPASWPTLAGGLLAVGGAALLSLAAYARRTGSRRRIHE